jgi:predicted permease
MRQDLIYAIRSLGRNAAFSTIAIVTVALGVGLNTSVFGIINVLLFRPPPADNPHELVWVSSSSTKPNGPRGNMTYPDVEDLRSLPVFRGVMAYGEVQANVAAGGKAERLDGHIVTGDYFQVLGTRPHRGRLVAMDDDKTGNSVAVISFRLWQRLFGGRTEAVGAGIRINGAPFTICGVAPPAFTGPSVFSNADVWVPMAASGPMNAAVSAPAARTTWWLGSIGRLAPGVSQTEASAAVRTRASSIAQTYPDSHDGFTVRLDRVGGAPPGDQGEAKPLAAILLGATMTVLLIACANVANLLLVRGVARGRETAIRIALGASRGRLVRQHLTESALLAICGGALGLLLSMWSTELLLRFAGVPLEADFSPDRLVLAFTVGVSVLTGLLFGVVPALRGALVSPAGSLKSEQGSGDARPRPRLQTALVIGQLAVSLILLVTASLFLKSLVNARAVDVGFDPDGRVSLAFNLRMNGYTAERALAFQEALLERARSLPGIRSVTAASLVPLGGRVWVSELTFPDRPADPDARPDRVSVNHVWPGFFGTLGIEIVAGRPLDERDMGTLPTSVVVNETMARQHWPGRNPVGQRFSVDGRSGPFVEVVGVARDIVIDELTERPWAAAYLPRQRTADDAVLIAHADIPEAEALRALEAQLHALDSSVAIFQPLTLRQHIAGRLDGERAVSRLLSVVGLLALTLAAIGLYGVIAYTVERRTREIGVRVALGARPGDVLRLFVGDAARLAVMGAAVGLLPAIGVTALLAGSLVGVTVADPIAIGSVMAVLTVVALVAAYLPARRAAVIDPLAALRRE